MSTLTLSAETRLVVERIKLFIRWHEARFDVLDAAPTLIENPVGWRRGDEYWIKPDIWCGQTFDDEASALHAARVLRDLGLLRTQAGPSLQCTVKVRGATPRAYAVSGDIFSWVARHGGNGCNRAGTWQAAEAETALITPANSGDPFNLSATLERATALALAKGIELLTLSPDPNDRHYAGVLRSQTTLVNTMLNTQLRVDEAKLQAKREDALDEHLKDCRACALATLGREMTREEVERVLGGAYERINKPPPPGVIERLREGLQPETRHDGDFAHLFDT